MRFAESGSCPRNQIVLSSEAQNKRHTCQKCSLARELSLGRSEPAVQTEIAEHFAKTSEVSVQGHVCRVTGLPEEEVNAGAHAPGGRGSGQAVDCGLDQE